MWWIVTWVVVSVMITLFMYGATPTTVRATNRQIAKTLFWVGVVIGVIIIALFGITQAVSALF